MTFYYTCEVYIFCILGLSFSFAKLHLCGIIAFLLGSNLQVTTAVSIFLMQTKLKYMQCFY